MSTSAHHENASESGFWSVLLLVGACGTIISSLVWFALQLEKHASALQHQIENFSPSVATLEDATNRRIAIHPQADHLPTKGMEEWLVGMKSLHVQLSQIQRDLAEVKQKTGASTALNNKATTPEATWTEATAPQKNSVQSARQSHLRALTRCEHMPARTPTREEASETERVLSQQRHTIERLICKMRVHQGTMQRYDTALSALFPETFSPH